MSSILVLLALLSIATLFARRGYAAFVAHIVSAPLLLGLGILIAPHSLAFLTPSMMEALEPAIRVACAWIALLVAMRGSGQPPGTTSARDVVVVVAIGAVTWISLTAAALAFLSLSARFDLGFAALKDELRATLGAALLLGGIVSTSGLAFAREALLSSEPNRAHRRLLLLARHDELAPAIAICLAVWLWPVEASVSPVYGTPWLAALVVVLLGLLLALAQLLSGAGQAGTAASFIALLGLITYSTGLSHTMLLPGAAVAFFLGSMLALFGQGQRALDAGLAQTERPVRLVLLVLVGAHVGFHPAAIAVGLGLALARVIVKALARSMVRGSTETEIPLSAMLGSAGATVPFVVSFALSRPEPLLASEVLTAVAACLAATDLMTLIAWRRSSVSDEDAVARMSAESA